MTPLARQLLARVPAGQPIPLYGSPEFDALPDQDPRRAASVARAAEAWLDHCSRAQVALDLLEELHRTDLELVRRVRKASWAVCAAADWSSIADRPTAAELQRRREVAA